jgi:hypothetical protein
MERKRKVCKECGHDNYDTWISRGGRHDEPIHVEMTAEETARLFALIGKIPIVKKTRKELLEIYPNPKKRVRR